MSLNRMVCGTVSFYQWFASNIGVTDLDALHSSTDITVFLFSFLIQSCMVLEGSLQGWNSGWVW